MLAGIEYREVQYNQTANRPNEQDWKNAYEFSPLLITGCIYHSTEIFHHSHQLLTDSSFADKFQVIVSNHASLYSYYGLRDVDNPTTRGTDGWLGSSNFEIPSEINPSRLRSFQAFWTGRDAPMLPVTTVGERRGAYDNVIILARGIHKCLRVGGWLNGTRSAGFKTNANRLAECVRDTTHDGLGGRYSNINGTNDVRLLLPPNPNLCTM